MTNQQSDSRQAGQWGSLRGLSPTEFRLQCAVDSNARWMLRFIRDGQVEKAGVKAQEAAHAALRLWEMQRRGPWMPEGGR